MIRAEGLSKRFDRLQVLDDVSFGIDPGGVTAILGPNASGKSTLIKCVLGLVRPDAGQVYVGGNLVLGGWEYRKNIGYMPQIARFPDNLKVAELLQLVMDIRGFSAPADDELLREFELEAIGNRPLRVLSGGTRQKINAAIAFMFAPEILILDEPTAGLDPISIALLKEKIAREAKGGRTIVLTSHNMQEVDEMADHILFLLDGRSCFDGSLLTLKEHTAENHLERAIISLMENNHVESDR